MGKINIAFVADNAMLRRDDDGNLIVVVSGVDEKEFNTARQNYHEQVRINKLQAERDAKVRAEAEKIVAEQEKANGGSEA